MLVAALYYVVFSLFFDTPIEHEVKKGIEQLDSHYAKLTAQRDSLITILENIEQRDSSVFEILFEARPFVDTINNIDGDDHKNLSELSLSELREHFLDQLSGMSDRVEALNRLYFEQIAYIDSSGHIVNHIPSIQPVDNKGLTLLAASFGERIHPFYKSKHFHKGVDFAVPVGTAVFATADGRVSSIETRGQSSGLSITLKHGDYETFYGNLDKVLVRPGATIERGDIIAFSGDSGLSFAPHLHYEVRYKGESIDPVPYFFGELSAADMIRMEGIASVAMQSFD